MTESRANELAPIDHNNRRRRPADLIATLGVFSIVHRPNALSKTELTIHHVHCPRFFYCFERTDMVSSRPHTFWFPAKVRKEDKMRRVTPVLCLFIVFAMRICSDKNVSKSHASTTGAMSQLAAQPMTAEQ